MTTDQQIAFDNEEPDQAKVHEHRRTPDEIAAFEEDGYRAAQALMKGALATPGVHLRPHPGADVMRRLFGKRWQQMRDSGYGREAAEEEAVEQYLVIRRRLDKEYNEALEEAKRERLHFLKHEGKDTGDPHSLFERD